ncbi:uncharacterized protein METZ01_LOCUS488570 [marine metagenome]|uniref:Uncharacterized protein n=1 Tax=marine metagenome TaxID=408172 RepID=A0A383CTP1_9ZZZZ
MNASQTPVKGDFSNYSAIYYWHWRLFLAILRPAGIGGFTATILCAIFPRFLDYFFEIYFDL